MSEIDPFEQPPVYKQDQVLTEADFRYLIDTYLDNEKKLFEAGYVKEAMQCCAVHSSLESVLEWVKKGKPKLEDADGTDTQDI